MNNMKLYNHQRIEIPKIISSLRTNGVALAHWTCGAGKTLIVPSVIDELRPRRALFVTPRLDLLDQQEDDIFRGNDHPDCLKFNSNGTTKLDDARAHLVGDFGGSRGRWVFVTRKSLSKLINGLTDIKFDLVVADEAHHLEAEELEMLRDSSKSFLLLTATPKVHTTDFVSAEAISTYSMAQAIADGITRGFNITAIGAGENVIVDDNGHSLPIREYSAMFNMMNGGIPHCRMISFHRSVSEAKAFAAAVNNLTDWNAASFTSQDSDAESDKAMSDFRNSDGGFVLCTVQKVVDGMNIPSCDAVMVLRGVGTAHNVIQIIGRCLRRPAGHVVGEHLDKANVFVAYSAEKDIEFFAAVADEAAAVNGDPNGVNAIKETSEAERVERFIKDRAPSDIKFLGVDEIDIDRLRMKRLGLNESSINWFMMFNTVRELGGAPVADTPEHAWVDAQRKNFKNLRVAQQEHLASLSWWVPVVDRSAERAAQKEITDQFNDDIWVIVRPDDKSGAAQRKRKMIEFAIIASRKGKLPEEFEYMMEEMDGNVCVDLVTPPPIIDEPSDEWKTMYAMWRDFIFGKRGDKREPRRDSADPAERMIARWVKHERHTASRGTSSRAAINILNNDKSWSWETSEMPSTTETLSDAKVFFSKFGHIPRWGDFGAGYVNSARKCKRNGTLSDIEARELESMGIEWTEATGPRKKS